MLIIQGQSNDNYLSLSERLSVQSGYTILVRFISEDTLFSTTTIPTVVSGTTAYRFHKLTITEKSNATEAERRAGNVTLDPYGTMLYEVYQTSGTPTTQATAIVNFDSLPADGDTFAFNYTGGDVVFTFLPSPTTPEHILLAGNITDQAENFFDTVSAWLAANQPDVTLTLLGTQLTFTCDAGGIYDGTVGNSLVINWANAMFAETSPLSFSGGADGIDILDYTLADKLLEVGKCLVTKNTGFDTHTEYTGATTVSETYAPRVSLAIGIGYWILTNNFIVQ